MIFDHRKFILKMVIAFWLIGWFIKSAFFIPYLFQAIVKYPIIHPIFPSAFNIAFTGQIFYLLPLFVVPCIFAKDQQYFKCAGCFMIISSIVMCLHNDTYSDATFVTSFWSALWIFWFACNANRVDRSFYFHAVFLAQCLVGMIFLGGFIGKLTPEFWKGNIFFHIFFESRTDGLLYGLNNYFSTASLKVFAMYSARVITCVEGFLMLVPLWPAKIFYRGVPFILLGFTITNTWRILSVVLCLIGMIAGVFLLLKDKKDIDFA